jgi:hypothetical protein
MTPITTVVRIHQLTEAEQLGLNEGKKSVYQNKTGTFRRGMTNWRACYPCDRVVKIEI